MWLHIHQGLERKVSRGGGATRLRFGKGTKWRLNSQCGTAAVCFEVQGLERRQPPGRALRNLTR